MAAEHVANTRGTSSEHRRSVPRSAHADWMPSPDRPDPVKILLANEDDQPAELLPLRNARMAASPAPTCAAPPT